MAWFFRHNSCSKEVSELRDELKTLKRQMGDLEDYVARLSGRVLKRIERQEKTVSRDDEAVAESALPAKRETIIERYRRLKA